MSSLDYLDLCRLCLVKDRVSVPIFEGEGDVRQIFLKIAACLPVKVAREDKLPKKICDDCLYKVELFYQFWNTTANAEKQLLQWLGEVGLEDKQGYVSNVLNPNVMKQEQSTENRLDGNVMQQVGEHQNNMGMGMMDNMGLGIPIIISASNQQQQITSVPMDTSGNNVQTVQAVPGPSSQTTHNQMSQNQTNTTQHEEEEESSEEEENSDDECDGDEGLPVKEESEEDPSSSRAIEPTTFVNVSLACDEAGPSGLQQQKMADIPEMPIAQPADGDPKSGISAQNLGGYFIVLQESFNNNSTPTIDRLNHEEIESNRLYSCNECDYRTNMKDNLQSHYLSEHMEKYVFDRHTNRFILKENLKSHTGTHENSPHIGTPTEKFVFLRRSRRFKLKENFTYERPSHYCDVCGKRYVLTSSLRMHKKSKHPVVPQFPCTLCDEKLMTQEKLENHLYLDHGKTHKCKQCGKIFATQKYLKEHSRVHGRVLPNTCAICKTVFPTADMRYLHLRVYPAENRLFPCDICGQSFQTQCSMFAHKRSIHHPHRACLPAPVRIRDEVPPRPVQIIVAATEVSEEILP